MTIYPALTLTADGLDDLVLDPATTYVFGQRLDLGYPIVRESVNDAPDADGTDDTTAYHGARTVLLELVLAPTAGLWALEQRLRGFMLARRRPVLLLQRAADAPLQQITLRPSNVGAVIGEALRSATQSDAEVQPVQLAWVAPYGIIESADLHDVSGFAAGNTLSGRAYSLTYSRVYPASSPAGTISITNAGTADAYPVVRLYGPCTNPVLINTTVGKQLAFTGVTLNAGDFYELDMRAKTIYFDGDPTDSRYDDLDFTTSDWWTLEPGENVLRYNPATFTASSAFAEVIWRDAWL